MSHFSKTLRNRRRDMGLTQAELARQIKVSRTAVAHFEEGRNTPTMKNLYSLMRVMGMSPNELLGEIKPRKKRAI